MTQRAARNRRRPVLPSAMTSDVRRSPLTETRISYSRQTDFIDPVRARETHCTVVGLGTVGSHVAVELARMGIGSLHLIDGDVVEEHNLPSQAYLVHDIDRPKAEACADLVRAVSDHVQVQAEQRMLAGGETFEPGPVILAVDSMDARKQILELSVAWRPTHPLLIDGRMGGDALQLYSLNPCDAAALERWGREWFPADDAHPVPCGGRSVSYVGAFIGGLIASQVAKQLRGESIPFFTMTDLRSLHMTQVRAA